MILLKLEVFSHVPTSAIDNLLEGLHFLFTTSALPLTNSLTLAVLKEHNIEVSASLVNELCTALYTGNPLLRSIAKGGSLETTFKRKKFYYEKFNVVELEEYVLEEKTKKPFQYIPLLKLLEQLLQREDIVGKLVENYKRSHSNSQLLTCFQDGENQKNNFFFQVKSSEFHYAYILMILKCATH